jgi:hypothetical protein
MRAEPYKFQAFVIGLAVEENEIRPDVAVSVIVPFAGQSVIEIPARQRRVHGEQVNDLTLKAGGVLNLPHSNF